MNMTHVKSPPSPHRAPRWSKAMATAVACFGLVGSAAAQTVFSENLGVPGGTVTLANYNNGTAPATFQNKGLLTFTNGGQTNPADIRTTSASSGYAGASGNGNVFFTSSAGAYGFGIEGINAAEYSSLSLNYAYRKESGTALPTFSVDYWNGTAWVTIENTTAGLFNQASSASTAWYTAKPLALPSAALINGLKIRFVKTGSVAIRIDDIVLTGTYTAPTLVVGPALSGFTSLEGAVSTAQSTTVAGYNLTDPITLTASSGFEVAIDNTSFGTSATLPSAGGSAQVRISATAPAGALTGTLSITSTGATTKSISLSGTVTPSNNPNVSVGGTPLTPMTTFAGSPSAARTFTVSGTNLTNDITVTPPTGYEVSLDGTTFSTTALTLVPTSGSASGTVSVRIPASATTSPAAGNITVNSTGIVAPITIPVSGTVTTPAFTVSLSPTSIPENSTEGSSGLVSIPAARPADLIVNLVSGNTSAATVPATVTIPAGETSAGFTVSVVANPTSFVNATAVITASASGITNGTSTLTVTNVDVPPLVAVSLTAVGTASTQDFDSLGTTSIPNAISNVIGTHASLGSVVASALNGWYATKIAGNGSTTTPITADIGSGTSGGVYNFGSASATERALGMIASGSNTMAIGALIKNDTTQTLSGLKISVTAEFWRSSTSNTNTMAFAYGKLDGDTFTNTNFLNASGATAFTSLNLVGPAPVSSSNGALNGNDPANQQSLVDVSFPVSLAPGEVAFIRWQDADEAGNDAGIAIDNFSVSGLANALVTPEFDLEAGTYFANQNVKIANFSSYTATEIRYTTDGSEPTASSTLYVHSTGIPIIAGNGNVTLKAKAFKAADSSLTATITYVMPKDVANLTALRASAVGTTLYRVTGPITFTAGTSNRNTKFFQDSGAGIHVDDNTSVINSVYTFGDNVVGAVGRLTLFNGQLQFNPAQDFGTPVSSGNTVSPLSVTLANLTDAYQAMLVTVTGVTFETPGATIAGLPTIVNVPIKDPSVTGFTGFLRNVFPDSNVTGSVTPSGTVSVTGLVVRTSASTPVFAVGPRNLADIVSTTPTNDFAAWSALYAPGQPATADHDNDGVSNGLEYFMGATGSTFTATPGLVAGKVTWPLNPNFVGTYSVQTSPDLVNWTNATSTVVGNSVEFTVPTGAGKVFVRMMVRIP